jgi:hypothetical protein
LKPSARLVKPTVKWERRAPPSRRTRSSCPGTTGAVSGDLENPTVPTRVSSVAQTASTMRAFFTVGVWSCASGCAASRQGWHQSRPHPDSAEASIFAATALVGGTSSRMASCTVGCPRDARPSLRGVQPLDRTCSRSRCSAPVGGGALARVLGDDDDGAPGQAARTALPGCQGASRNHRRRLV